MPFGRETIRGVIEMLRNIENAADGLSTYYGTYPQLNDVQPASTTRWLPRSLDEWARDLRNSIGEWVELFQPPRIGQRVRCKRLVERKPVSAPFGACGVVTGSGGGLIVVKLDRPLKDNVWPSEITWTDGAQPCELAFYADVALVDERPFTVAYVVPEGNCEGAIDHVYAKDWRAAENEVREAHCDVMIAAVFEGIIKPA